MNLGRNERWWWTFHAITVATALMCGCRSPNAHRPKERDPLLEEAIQAREDAQALATAQTLGKVIFWAVYGEPSPDPDRY